MLGGFVTVYVRQDRARIPVNNLHISDGQSCAFILVRVKFEMKYDI
jgi:hypothetical protein